MTAILGISGLQHDSAAALVINGRIVAAAQEERFTRTQHDGSMPVQAIRYCLDEAGIRASDLDFVGFYDRPDVTAARLLKTCFATSPRGFRQFVTTLPEWLTQKLTVPRRIRAALGGRYRGEIIFADHHVSHAASAFFPSPFHKAAILTADGTGGRAVCTYGTGCENAIDISHEIRFPHSVGVLYSAFTSYCGFRPNADEDKLMGLAPYGVPGFADRILQYLIDLKDDGSFQLNSSYFSFSDHPITTNRRFHRLFGAKPRDPRTRISQRDMDLAASVQHVTEKILLRMARHIHNQTGFSDLCLAGGVALNSTVNRRILRDGPFDRIWIQPAAGNAGTALGVACYIWYQLLNNDRDPDYGDGQQGSYLGPQFTSEDVCAFLNSVGADYRRFTETRELCKHVAGLLDQEMIVGWVQGRMEFGPQALGARSILGDPRSPRMHSLMSRKISFRESFRPFAPSVLANRVSEFFEIQPAVESPYMLLDADIDRRKRLHVNGNSESLRGLERLKINRSVIPAATHVDHSARVQTVDPHRHARYYQLLKQFEELTGSPVIINSTFCVTGMPIVCSPRDAWQCFMSTNMDVLVMEDCVLLKEEQNGASEHQVDEFMAQSTAFKP